MFGQEMWKMWMNSSSIVYSWSNYFIVQYIATVVGCDFFLENMNINNDYSFKLLT